MPSLWVLDLATTFSAGGLVGIGVGYADGFRKGKKDGIAIEKTTARRWRDMVNDDHTAVDHICGPHCQDLRRNAR